MNAVIDGLIGMFLTPEDQDLWSLFKLKRAKSVTLYTNAKSIDLQVGIDPQIPIQTAKEDIARANEQALADFLRSACVTGDKDFSVGILNGLISASLPDKDAIFLSPHCLTTIRADSLDEYTYLPADLEPENKRLVGKYSGIPMYLLNAEYPFAAVMNPQKILYSPSYTIEYDTLFAAPIIKSVLGLGFTRSYIPQVWASI